MPDLYSLPPEERERMFAVCRASISRDRGALRIALDALGEGAMLECFVAAWERT